MTERRHAARLRIVERVLLGAAVILLCGYAAVRVSSARDQMASARELDAMRTLSASRRTGAPALPHRPLQAGALVGRIEIPRLELSAMVREGDDAGTLRSAVGHIPGTAAPGEPGNAGLAGHRDTFFRELRNIRAGDLIVVTTPESIFRYTVSDTHIVGPADVSVLDPTPQRTLTLVTCYPFTYVGPAPRRFIVRAELTEPTASDRLRQGYGGSPAGPPSRAAAGPSPAQ